MSRMLIAGVGNIFLGDDGFGPEVARRLACERWGDDVSVADFGIRGVHLAYELSAGYDVAIIVDTVSRGAPPGTIYVIEPDRESADPGSIADAHDMVLDNVFAMVHALGGKLPPRVLLVGCEPADLGEKIGFSEPVKRAIPDALRTVREMVVEAFSCLYQMKLERSRRRDALCHCHTDCSSDRGWAVSADLSSGYRTLCAHQSNVVRALPACRY
jgi:hydrogenase maturation protease